MCGTEDLKVIGDYDETEQITVTGLAKGYSCFYRFKATCGAPTFKVDLTNSSKFEVEFVEFISE